MSALGWVLVTVLVGVLGCGTTAAGPGLGPAVVAPEPAAPEPAAPPGPVRVLQLNLCNSGIASCFSGRATTEAVAVIRAERPDVVTLNEICRDDLAVLETAFTDAGPPGAVTSAFQPARNGDTGEAYLCRNGQEYGIGIVSRRPPGPDEPVSGIFPAQDPADPEKRAWLCLHSGGDTALSVCTTHLAYTVRAVTVDQCRYLFDTVVADLRERDGRPVVVAADLNLGSGDDPDLGSCLPTGSARADDGRVQHVVGTPGLTVSEVRTVDLNGATDHPGLLVSLALP